MGTKDKPHRYAHRVSRRVPIARLRVANRQSQGSPARRRFVSYLLDTNVVSEWTRPRPDPAVVAFLESTDEDTMYLSVITLAELRRGVDRLHTGRRRAALDAWLDNDLVQRFDGRILGVD